ncbi:MAG: hypothetical protein ACRYFX_08190 [Janthinobacterium lividum]
MKSYRLIPLLLVVFACQKEDVPAVADNVLSVHFALLDKQGNNLLTSTTPIQVYSLSATGQKNYLGSECAGGACTMVREAHAYNGQSLKYKFNYETGTIHSASLNGSAKTWYIELGGKTDTLFYDAQYNQPNVQSGDYSIKAVMFNGKVAAIDPDQLPVYVLQRRH